MSTLTNHKKEARKMFFISVDKDIDKWHTRNDHMYSEYYISDPKDREYTQFSINNITHELILMPCFKKNITICKYKKSFFLYDIKVYLYVLKLKRHFIKREIDKINSEEIDIIKSSLSKIKTKYKSAIRKEKLTKLS